MTFSPYSSPAFIICRCFDDGHSVHGEMIPHCSFDLHFSNNEQCWISFCVPLADCMSSSKKVKDLPIFDYYYYFLILSCMSCSYILEVNTLLVASFVNIFFYSIDCLFVYGFLCCAKALSLFRFYLIIFVFISIGLGNLSKKNSCSWCPGVFCLCFPLRVL